MTEAISYEAARKLDAADPLREFRDRFEIGQDPVAYLDGNSLGRPPKATLARIRQEVEERWAGRLIRGWPEHWMELPTRVGDLLGEAVLGAAQRQTVLADSTSVNLYKVLHAACALRPDRTEIVIDDTNFPTDRYIVEAVAAQRGLTVRWLVIESMSGVTAEQLAPLLGPETAVVVLCHVDYRSSAIADVAGLTARIHETGAVAVWDACHSAGVLPIDVDAAGVDFCVGCTYKFLNAGPGAPAFLYVAERHLADLRQPITGWIGAEDVFAMAPTYEPAKGIRRMLSGTPNVLGIAAVEEGVRLVAEAGLDRIRAKGAALTDMAVGLVDEWLAPAGVELLSPRDPARRGCHLIVRHPDAETVTERLIDKGVIPDYRNPRLIRLGLSPLTTSYAEAWSGLDVMRGIIAG
jgi:kynureninase